MGLWLVILFAGLPIVLKALDAASHTRCRWCGTDVRREAKVCPGCGHAPRSRPTSS